ncbi:MAG TPA: tetratricopeptide repeat protein, partial [Chloroflexota bacterium]|nr:tetratricopeptide repeat protein [Chloroflexota bacterium]
MKTPSAVAASHLPATVDRFIGRERELQAIASLFNQPHVRLVTLTGTGGSGKTRLALQAAARLDGAFEVVCFVPLASVQDPAHVASTLARVLDVEDSGAQPTVEALQHFLRNRQVLLVLDNFEHVAAAAPVVADLLRSCPCLQVLVTSRESLRLSGEHEFPVLPLQLPDAMAPDPATIGRVESVALFVQRSRAVNPNFILTKENARDVAEICVRLEGLPLSIELAAARSKVLPPKTLLARLSSRLAFLTGGARDLPDRQRTLRNTLDWSYALLDPNEQVLFARLAVFVGGASLGAVEAVCGGAFAVLESLVAKSLVRQEQPALAEPRVMLLETVREYALEHLTDSGELEAMRRQHATYFLSLALQAEPELRGPQQAEWVRRLEDEHSNIQASLRWWLRCAREDGTVAEQCLRLAGALWRFWWVRGHVSLGRAQLVEVLALPAPIEHTEAYVAARAEATFGAGVLSVVAGDHAGSRTLFHESLALWQQLGDEAGVAYVLQNLGEIEMDLGAYASAYALLTRSVSTFRRIDDQQGLAWPLSALGFVALEQHDFTTAYDALQESLVIFRDRGEQMGVAQTLHFLALFHEDQEHHALAWDLFRQSLEIRHDVGDRPGTVLTLEGIAGLAAACGQTQLAALLAGATA